MKWTYVQRMFIRIGIRNTRNTDVSLGTGMKLLLPSLILGFQYEERETLNFSMLTVRPSLAFNSLTQPTHVRTSQFITGPASPRSKNKLASSKSKSQLLLLLKITKNPSPSLPDMTSFTSPVTFLIWGFYCDICDCHILPARREHLHSMCAPN